jgi:hypothetical protein
MRQRCDSVGTFWEIHLHIVDTGLASIFNLVRYSTTPQYISFYHSLPVYSKRPALNIASATEKIPHIRSKPEWLCHVYPLFKDRI